MQYSPPALSCCTLQSTSSRCGSQRAPGPVQVGRYIRYSLGPFSAVLACCRTPGPRVTYCVQTVVGTKRQVCAWPCKYHTILNNMMCKALCKKTYLLSCVISTPWTLLDAMRSCGPSEGTPLVLTFRKAICGCPAPCDQSLRMLSRFVKEKKLVLSCSNFKGMPE